MGSSQEAGREAPGEGGHHQAAIQGCAGALLWPQMAAGGCLPHPHPQASVESGWSPASSCPVFSPVGSDSIHAQILSSSWAENCSWSVTRSSRTGPPATPTRVACHPTRGLAPLVSRVCPQLSAPSRAGPEPTLPSEQPWEPQAGGSSTFTQWQCCQAPPTSP